MTEEQRVRRLLTAAAELPDLVPAPVERLIAVGRRRRRRHRIVAAAATVVAVAAAVTIPAAMRGTVSPRPVPPQNTTGVTAAELTRGHWKQLPPPPSYIAEGFDTDAFWTGHELLVVVYVNAFAGAAYTPGQGWHSIARIPNGLGNDMRDVVWTGSRLVVLRRGPHAGHGGPASVAAIYSPASNTWSKVGFPLPTDHLSSNPGLAVASFDDRIVFAEMVSGRLEAASYSTSTGSFRSLQVSLPAAHRVSQLSMIGANGRLILWSSWNNGSLNAPARAGTSGVDVRVMNAGGSWYPVTGWPQDLVGYTPQSASGGRILLVSGAFGLPHAPAAYLVDAATLRLRPVPASPLGSEAGELWTGAAVVAVGSSGHPAYPAAPNYAVTALDPWRGGWTRPVAGPREQSPAMADSPVSVVWAGNMMVVTNGRFAYAFAP